jgi:hypothetical protein
VVLKLGLWLLGVKQRDETRALMLALHDYLHTRDN